MVPEVVPEAPGAVKAMQKSPKRVQKRLAPAHPQHFGGKMVPREAPKGPQRAPKCVNHAQKMASFSKSVSKPRFLVVFHGFVVDFDQKKELKFACFKQSLHHVNRRSFSTLF